MVWTQIQLTEEQAARLKRLAQEERASQAELVRRAVGRFLQEEANGGFAERRPRTQAAVEPFDSRPRDMGQAHDCHLRVAFGSLR